MTDRAVKDAVDARATAERVHSAAIRLLRKLRRDDDKGGLSGPQASAISVLVFGGERSLGQLAAAEQVTAPTMSRLITQLEAEGLVERRPHPSDARGVLLRATNKGRALLQQAQERRLGRLEKAVAELPEEDRRTLAGAAELLMRMVESPDFDR
ncbi:MAG TPA: MarR family transcriptional regulator [Caulobacteraceae bacterium]|jgi:DNA-binding MarR family transcriptional regulator